MSINTWNPDSELQKKTPAATSINLQDYIDTGASASIEEEIRELAKSRIDELTPLMKQPENYWRTATKSLPDANLWHLIRFFTVAEEIHGQLFAGKESPVIALNRLLKQRNAPLSREQILWIKSHTTNRYLPNGSVL